jgi:diacylglycerol kinase (ATP)
VLLIVGYTVLMHRLPKKFSLRARVRSFSYAWRGLGIIAQTQHNFWIQIIGALAVIVMGRYYHISKAEWLALVLATTSVIVSESFNTALEIDINLTSPGEHPYARDTKDVAAAAVLLTVIGAITIGLIIFIPKVFH